MEAKMILQVPLRINKTELRFLARYGCLFSDEEFAEGFYAIDMNRLGKVTPTKKVLNMEVKETGDIIEIHENEVFGEVIDIDETDDDLYEKPRWIRFIVQDESSYIPYSGMYAEPWIIYDKEHPRTPVCFVGFKIFTKKG